MFGMLIRRALMLLIGAAFFGATVIAAGSPVGSCPGLESHIHSAHDHHTGHHHSQHSSDKAPRECLKCCLGACLGAAGLTSPNLGLPELAFAGIPVLYWPGSLALVGHSAVPDPGPPKPIT